MATSRESGDVRIFHTDHGSREVVLLLVHGWGGDGREWSPHVEALAGRHRIIVPDLRGHGHSEVPAEDNTPHAMARDLAALVARLGTGPVVAVGHSMGGQVVNLLAVEHPETVRSVVALGPAHGADGDEAAGLGAELLPLDELLRTSAIVSVHAPEIPPTRGLLDRRRLALMPDGSVLVNTARGALVDHDALIAELATGRISAVLDVTDPEPPPADSPLFRLPNVFLTPHVAGSMGNELERLGGSAVEEIARLTGGRPFAHQVSKSDLERVA